MLFVQLRYGVCYSKPQLCKNTMQWQSVGQMRTFPECVSAQAQFINLPTALFSLVRMWPKGNKKQKTNKLSPQARYIHLNTHTHTLTRHCKHSSSSFPLECVHFLNSVLGLFTNSSNCLSGMCFLIFGLKFSVSPFTLRQRAWRWRKRNHTHAHSKIGHGFPVEKPNIFILGWVSWLWEAAEMEDDSCRSCDIEGRVDAGPFSTTCTRFNATFYRSELETTVSPLCSVNNISTIL